MSHTEQIIASNYTREIVGLSKLVEGLRYHEKTIRRCTRCGREETGDFPYGKQIRCISCGLNMKAWGNALYISDGIIEEGMEDD